MSQSNPHSEPKFKPGDHVTITGFTQMAEGTYAIVKSVEWRGDFRGGTWKYRVVGYNKYWEHYDVSEPTYFLSEQFFRWEWIDRQYWYRW